ncbi:MAG: helix-hairpin-helix domain-containing protein [Schleiferiaceae bacterium]|jgi:hypothetical protein|nr:helix-hairpin-helix domain-containing protein [Schleiferiaceae bacterium]
MVKQFSIALFALLTFSGYTQNQTKAQEVLDQLKQDPRFEDGGADWVQFSELLLNYAKEPISLNKATLEELEAFPLLTKFQAYHIVNHRRKTGAIVSYYELLQLKNFDQQLIEYLKPFTNLNLNENKINFNNLLNGRHQAAIRYQRLIQEKKGQGNNEFAGDANALYARYRFSYHNKIFAGFTLQKDAGEPYLISGKPYPDYSSYHLEIRNSGFVKKVIVGDFLTNYGQGLALWTTRTFGKTAEVNSTQRFGQGLRYYSGADENRFFRGGAISLGLDRFSLDVFASSNRVDATIREGFASSLTESGLHRSSNELQKRKIQQIRSLGGHLGWQSNSLELGITGYHYSFSIPIAQNSSPYAVHRFHGKDNTVISFDFQWMLNTTILYGEFARSNSNGMAAIAGFKTQPADALTINGLYRNLAKDYHTMYSAPFSETGNAGEEGFYLGLSYILNPYWSIKGYLDRYKFNWLRFQTAAPSHGEDYLLQLDLKKSKTYVYLRYRYRNGKVNESQENLLGLLNAHQHLWRLHGNYQVHRNTFLSTRIEIRTHHQSENKLSYLFYQELKSTIKNTKLKAYFRVSFFKSEDFRTSLYAREDDLPYTYNLAQFHREGIKYYIMLRYDLNPLSFYLRWAHIDYTDVETIGSGNDLILGNERSEIKAMIALKL